MRVRINKPGNTTRPPASTTSVSPSINFDLIPAAQLSNQSIANEHSAVRNDAKLAQLRPNARTRWSSQRHQLRTVNNRERLTFFF